MQRICGIYMIRNTLDGKVYVGQSYDIAARWRQHKKEARRGSVSYLYKAMRLHGIEAFELVVLEECASELLDSREAHWMAHHHCHDREKGYNYRPAGQLTQAVTPEARASISARLSGRKLSPEHVERMRQSKMGVPVPESAKQKLREFHTGIVLPKEDAERLKAEVARQFPALPKPRKRNIRTAAYTTEEFRQRCSERFKGKPKSAAFKEQQRARMLNEDPEVRERRLAALRAVTKARWEKYRAEKAKCLSASV